MIIQEHPETSWRIYTHKQDGFNTGEFYISCTTILECVVHAKLKQWFQNNSAAKQEKIKAVAATAGTDLHRLIEAHENSRCEGVQIGDYESEQIRRWEKLKEENQIQVHKTECAVYDDQLWVAGTADYILSFAKGTDRVVGIGDLKTGRYDIKAGWQMAFYLHAYQHTVDPLATSMIGLSLPRDLSRAANAFVYQHVDSCWHAYVSAWNCFRMMYWNQLEKMNWKGLKTKAQTVLT